MQQIKKKLYVEPRVKSVKFQVEQGFTVSDPKTCRFISNNRLEGYDRLAPDTNFVRWD